MNGGKDKLFKMPFSSLAALVKMSPSVCEKFQFYKISLIPVLHERSKANSGNVSTHLRPGIDYLTNWSMATQQRTARMAPFVEIINIFCGMGKESGSFGKETMKFFQG